jgi:hypothetical protein
MRREKRLKLRDRFGAGQREPIASGGCRLRKGKDGLCLLDDGRLLDDVLLGERLHQVPVAVALVAPAALGFLAGAVTRHWLGKRVAPNNFDSSQS